MKCSLLSCRLSIVFLLGALITNAQTTNTLFQHLPPDAERIYHVNLASLGSKISLDDVLSMIPSAKNSKDQNMIDMFKAASSTGVDFKQDIFVAQTGKGLHGDSATYITILFHLTDSGKMISFLRQKEQSIHRMHLPGKGQVVTENKIGMAFDDKMAVVTYVIPPVNIDKLLDQQYNKSGTKKPGTQKPAAAKPTTTTSTAAYTLKAAKKSMAALEGFPGSFYATDPVFMAGFSDDADFHMWGPHGDVLSKLGELAKSKSPFKGMNTSQMNSGLHTLTTFRFDAGKITLRTATVIPADSARSYQILASRPLNTDLISRLPGKALLGMVNIHFDPTMLKIYLDKYHLRHMVDSALEKKGLTIDEVLKAFKGDFLLAAMQPTVLPDTGKKGEPDVAFVTTIGDLATFMKVAGKLGVNSDTGSNFMGKKTTYTLKDNILVVGKTKALTDAYFSNSSTTMTTGLVNDRVRTNTLSVAVDAKAITAFIQAVYPDPPQKMQQILHFLSAVDKLTYTAGGYSNGVLESYFELKMADGSENALRSILKLVH